MFGHYTTLPGMLGILGTGTLWATNIKFLNDAQEFSHAIDLAEAAIPSAAPPPDHPDHSIFSVFEREVLDRLKFIDSASSDLIFTVSFSQETDLISQWRGYCPNNDGYCLVLDLDMLLQETKAVYPEADLVTCVYDHNQKWELLQSAIQAGWWSYSGHAKEDNPEKAMAIDDLIEYIRFLASYFKHPSFAEERESRIVVALKSLSGGDVKFRIGKFSLIPYIEIPTPHKTVKSLVIGPTLNRNLAKRALQMYIEERFGLPYFMGEVEMTFSDTPYRPW